MSTLVAEFLQDLAFGGRLSMRSTISGVPKVWGLYNYTGGVPSNTASFNVSSLSDTGVGRLDINHTTALAMASFPVQVMTWASTSWVKGNGATSQGASQHSLYMTEGTGSALTDPGFCSSLVCGNMP